jgi:hypothetical protein
MSFPAFIQVLPVVEIRRQRPGRRLRSLPLEPAGDKPPVEGFLEELADVEEREV